MRHFQTSNSDITQYALLSTAQLFPTAVFRPRFSTNAPSNTAAPEKISPVTPEPVFEFLKNNPNDVILKNILDGFLRFPQTHENSEQHALEIVGILLSGKYPIDARSIELSILYFGQYGETPKAIELFERFHGQIPYNEAVHIALIDAYAKDLEHEQVHRVFDQLMPRDSIDPSPETFIKLIRHELQRANEADVKKIFHYYDIMESKFDLAELEKEFRPQFVLKLARLRMDLDVQFRTTGRYY